MLLEKDKEMLVYEMREKLMLTLLPEIKAYIQVLTNVKLRELYHDWNFQNKNGLIAGISTVKDNKLIMKLVKRKRCKPYKFLAYIFLWVNSVIRFKFSVRGAQMLLLQEWTFLAARQIQPACPKLVVQNASKE